MTDNRRKSRLELVEDGKLALLAYRWDGDRLVLVHTEVPEALEGRGLGGRLVGAAVDVASEAGATVVPVCPFARSWLERHPDEAARVPVAMP